MRFESGVMRHELLDIDQEILMYPQNAWTLYKSVNFDFRQLN